MVSFAWVWGHHIVTSCCQLQNSASPFLKTMTMQHLTCFHLLSDQNLLQNTCWTCCKSKHTGISSPKQAQFLFSPKWSNAVLNLFFFTLMTKTCANVTVQKCFSLEWKNFMQTAEHSWMAQSWCSVTDRKHFHCSHTLPFAFEQGVILFNVFKLSVPGRQETHIFAYVLLTNIDQAQQSESWNVKSVQSQFFSTFWHPFW